MTEENKKDNITIEEYEKFVSENEGNGILSFATTEDFLKKDDILLGGAYNYLLKLIQINLKIQINNQNIMLEKINQITNENIRLTELCKTLFDDYVLPSNREYFKVIQLPPPIAPIDSLKKFDSIIDELTKLKSIDEINFYNNEKKE